MSFTRASYSKSAIRQEHTVAAKAYGVQDGPKSISIGRILSSAAALILGLTFCYSGLHYIPTLLKPTEVVDIVTSPNETSLIDIDYNRMKRFGIYAQSFLLRRTYLRAGQELTVHYTLAEGASLDLNIKQCRRMFIVEVFKCIPMSEQSLTISKKTSGLRSLKFSQPGFYHFDETVNIKNPDDPYKIIWVRS